MAGGTFVDDVAAVAEFMFTGGSTMGFKYDDNFNSLTGSAGNNV